MPIPTAYLNSGGMKSLDRLLQSCFAAEDLGDFKFPWAAHVPLPFAGVYQQAGGALGHVIFPNRVDKHLAVVERFGGGQKILVVAVEGEVFPEILRKHRGIFRLGDPEFGPGQISCVIVPARPHIFMVDLGPGSPVQQNVAHRSRLLCAVIEKVLLEEFR